MPPTQSTPHKSRGTSPTHGQESQANLAVTAFQGPIPPPEVLAGYDRIQPGAANRIIRMAENQARHRQELEKGSQQATIQIEQTSMRFSFFITIGLLVAGIFLVANDKDLGWFAIFGPSVFEYGLYIQRKRTERKQRSNE